MLSAILLLSTVAMAQVEDPYMARDRAAYEARARWEAEERLRLARELVPDVSAAELTEFAEPCSQLSYIIIRTEPRWSFNRRLGSEFVERSASAFKTCIANARIAKEASDARAKQEQAAAQVRAEAAAARAEERRKASEEAARQERAQAERAAQIAEAQDATRERRLAEVARKYPKPDRISYSALFCVFADMKKQNLDAIAKLRRLMKLGGAVSSKELKDYTDYLRMGEENMSNLKRMGVALMACSVPIVRQRAACFDIPNYGHPTTFGDCTGDAAYFPETEYETLCPFCDE